MLPAYFTEELVELIVGDAPGLPPPPRAAPVRLRPGAAGDAAAVQRRGCTARSSSAWRRRSPASGLGADVITGFPGETDADFDATEALVEALPFTYLHVFSYSDRRGTEAARGTAPRVPPGTIRQRTARLRRLGAAKQLGVPAGPDRPRARRCSSSSTGSERRGGCVGLTDNYLELAFPGPDALMRGFARVRATGQDGAQTGRSARQRWVSRESASSGAAGSTSWRA